ncbi:MAG: hypothetical protein AAB443_01515 [Patescibacteria group bacterium]
MNKKTSSNQTVLRAISVISALVLVFSTQVRTSYAGGNWVWDQAVGFVLGDKNDLQTLVTGTAIGGIAGAGYILVTGCTYDQMIDKAKGVASECDPTLQIVNSKSSMLAFAVGAMDSAIEAPPVMNLAYYFNSMKSDSVLFRQAYAAPSPAFQAVIDMWKAMRNLAYGLLAAFVLVVAFMITMRSKIDPQTVVTAQSAIPRIVISAVLITISYALGSLFDQMIGRGWNSPLVGVASWLAGPGGVTGQGIIYVIQGVWPPICSSYQAGNLTGAMQCLLAILGNVSNAAVSGGLGLFILLEIILALVLLVIMLIVFLTSYVKVIARTIISPMIFAVAAIPGQEHRIKDWFKDMLADTLALPVIVFLMAFGLVIFFKTAAAAAADPNTNVAAGFLSDTLAVVAAHMILMATWVMAIKAPGLVRAAIQGPKTR